MGYTMDFDKTAKKFKEYGCFVITEDNKYRVWINNVYYKSEKDLRVQHHVPICGLGFTLADATEDFLRISRSGFLYHIITNQVEKAI